VQRISVVPNAVSTNCGGPPETGARMICTGMEPPGSRASDRAMYSSFKCASISALKFSNLRFRANTVTPLHRGHNCLT
jgi:hypothetical protein